MKLSQLSKSLVQLNFSHFFAEIFDKSKIRNYMAGRELKFVKKMHLTTIT